MTNQRIGDILQQMGKLTAHDIDEILAEQRASHARFGTIAVAMGFCDPEHVWAAWCAQLSHRIQLVDLDEIGIDAQAVDAFPSELAQGLRAMPIRLSDDSLIVAVPDPSRASGVAEAARRMGILIKCVLAEGEQIDAALQRYYVPLAQAC